jgi:anti-sigma-K factor RskA
MRIGDHRLLDALCAEYLLGTLRGGARRRFEAALQAEPLVALRLRHWETTATPRYSQMIELQPPASAWRKLERELDLTRFRPPWYRRAGFWQGWAAAASAAALLVLALALRPPVAPEGGTEIAQLAPQQGGARVHAERLADGRTLRLRAERPLQAGPNQSFELWVIAPGAAPVSLAVLGSLDARVTLPAELAQRLVAGATLAVSAEPAGGSPTGQPTGAIVLVGRIAA